MKARDYPGFYKLLTKALKRKFYPFMDFGDCMERKNSLNVYQFPIKNYYNKKREGQ
jgi:hypothetical protein